MELTDHHAKYIAHQLTRRCPPDSIEKLAAALVDAQVDLNPHQVDAALFAFRSPLSKGALLADEVGLGKTIEAGLVLSQKWAERKRRILVIVPSNLRTQWYQELTEKFFLPCRILESKSYNAAIKQGQFRPFEAAEIVICYGQLHDVVVVNFLNRSNAADLRVFQLLAEKFQLFEGVFGSSDEILGAIESGVDFEKRIAAIYQRCRKPEEIQTAFDQLQLELSFEINEAMARLITLPGTVNQSGHLAAAPAELGSVTQQRQAAIQRGVSERNARLFEAEADKLDGWTDDLKLGLEREIKEFDRQIKEARRVATTALTLQDKLTGQKRIKALEA